MDQSTLEQLTAAFAETTGLPVHILGLDGFLLAGGQQVCKVCATAAGDGGTIPWKPPKLNGASMSEMADCRCGLSVALEPISAASVGELGSVLMGPLATGGAGIAAARRSLLERGVSSQVVKAVLSGVVRANERQARNAAKFLAYVLKALVDQAAVANESAELIAKQSQANRDLSVLYTTARSPNSESELDLVLQRLVDTLGETMGVEIVDLWLVEGNELVSTYTRGILRTDARASRLRIGEGFSGRVAATGEPLACADIQSDPRLRLTAITRRQDTHSFAGVPIKLQGETIGVLSVFRRKPYLTPEGELNLLVEVANQTAVAIDRARRYQQECARLVGFQERLADLERQQQIERQLAAINDRLGRLFLENRGLQSLVDAAAQLLENPVMVEDQFLNRLAHSAGEGDGDHHDNLADNAEARRAYEVARQDLRSATIPALPDVGAKASRLLAPVVAGHEVLGYVSVVEKKPLGELGYPAIERVATIIASELVKQRAIAQAEQRLRGSLLDDLIECSGDDHDSVRRRAAQLGYNLNLPYAVYVVELGDFQPGAIQQVAVEEQLKSAKKALQKAVRSAMTKWGQGVMHSDRGGSFVLAAPLAGGTTAEARELAESFRRDLSTPLPELNVSIGIGRVSRGIQEIARAYAEAGRALDLFRLVGGKGRTVAFEDLGVYRLLLNVSNPAELLAFADEFLGPLERYDREHHTELVQTLAAYLSHNFVLQQAARSLNLHVNTLVYRLQRIRSLTGLDLDDSETLLNLHLAVKFRRVGGLLIG